MADEVKDETVDSTNDTETTENEETLEQSDDSEALKAANKKLFERAKKAEADKRELKAKLEEALKKPETKTLENNAQVSAEELKLIARGLSDEEIDEAKAIAKGKDISLSDALKTKTFQAFQKELKEEQKKEQAKLGATRGSTQQSKKTFRPGMTPEEHKELWKETYGQ